MFAPRLSNYCVNNNIPYHARIKRLQKTDTEESVRKWCLGIWGTSIQLEAENIPPESDQNIFWNLSDGYGIKQIGLSAG